MGCGNNVKEIINMQILTISVGIPAHNEESNIKQLIASILAQKQEGFSVNEIVIVSDGSTDRTVQQASAVDNSIVKVLDDGQRKGKIVRMNELFERCKADILVQFDADVILKGERVLIELLQPFHADPTADLVCGAHEPLPYRTFVERLTTFGENVWERAKSDLNGRAEAYQCGGQIRAFSRKMYSAFRLPARVTSGEDVYTFYYAKQNKYIFRYAAQAVVYFRLASNFHDYIKQLTRFVGVHDRLRTMFDRQLLNEYETMSEGVKWRALFKEAIHTPPHVVVSYLALQAIPRVLTKFRKQKKIWDVATSSKQLE